MSCQKCGTTAIVAGCGECDGSCGQAIGTCVGAAVQTAVPYYDCVPMCQEDNTHIINKTVLVGAFRNKNSFAIPDCGKRLRVQFDLVGDVPLQAWLWAYGYGFLTIVGYNSSTQEIELQNDCPQLNCSTTTQAVPGTPVPACTVWALTAPNCSLGSSGTLPAYPYLDSGFTAPADGSCIDIVVTNVQGLVVNRLISINNGIYRLSAIKSPTLITICNDGDGLTPGTVVNYQDGNGNLIVPIVLIDSNPCLNPTVTSGKMMVCKNNNLQPLTGNANGQIPVFNQSTGEVDFKTLAVDVLDCTELTVDLTLNPALPVGTQYIALVLSTTGFTAGLLITIGNVSFSVASVTNATQMRVVPTTHPLVVTTFNAGSLVCKQGCCAQIVADYGPRITTAESEINTLQAEMVTANTDINKLENEVYNNVPNNGCVGVARVAAAASTSGANFTGGPVAAGVTLTGTPATRTLVNTSCLKNMVAKVTYSAQFVATLLGAAGTYGEIQFTLAIDPNPAAPTTPSLNVVSHPEITDVPATLTQTVISKEFTYTETYVIPPLATFTFSANTFLRYTAGNAAGGLQAIIQSSRISAIGVSVS